MSPELVRRSSPWEITFLEPGYTDVPQLLVGPTSQIPLTITTVHGPQLAQVFSTTAIGGTFALTYNGYTTAPIAFNAPATGTNSVEAALESLVAGRKLYYDTYGNRTIDGTTVVGTYRNADHPAMIPVYDSVFIPLQKRTSDSPVSESWTGFFDQLILNDSGNPSSVTGRLTPTTVVGLTPAGKEPEYYGLENVVVTLGNNGNNFFFDNSAGGGATLNTGGGNDIVTVIALSGRAAVSTVTEGQRAGNEVQEISLGEDISEVQTVYTTAVGGTFVLNFKETATASTKTTAAIAFNDTAASVKAKLEAIVLDNSQHPSVKVNGNGSFADPWQITFLNPALQDIPQMAAVGSLTGGTVTVGTITNGRAAVVGGTFALKVQKLVGGPVQTTAAIPYNATAAQLKSALENLGGISVDVTGTGRSADPWRVTFLTPGLQDVPQMFMDPASNTLVVGGQVIVATENERAALRTATCRRYGPLPRVERSSCRFRARLSPRLPSPTTHRHPR